MVVRPARDGWLSGDQDRPLAAGGGDPSHRAWVRPLHAAFTGANCIIPGGAALATEAAPRKRIAFQHVSSGLSGAMAPRGSRACAAHPPPYACSRVNCVPEPI